MPLHDTPQEGYLASTQVNVSGDARRVALVVVMVLVVVPVVGLGLVVASQLIPDRLVGDRLIEARATGVM